MTPITLAQSGANGHADETLAEGAWSLVQAMPIEAHAALGVLLIAGLGLWLFGGKIIKPLFGLSGMVLGGVVGLIAVPAFVNEMVVGQPGSLVGAGVGVVIGLVVAMMALKASIVIAAGLGFAAAGFLGGAIYLSYNPLPDESPPPAFKIDDNERSPDGRLLFENPKTGERMTIVELTRSLREADSFLGGGSAGIADDERLRAIAVRCEAIIRESVDLVKSHWNALSMRERVVVAGSTFGGLALGLFVGFFMPKKSTAFITALAGSAVWLASAGLLIDAFVPSMRGVTDQPPAVWAFVWAFVFLLGLVAQLAGLGKASPGQKKRRKKPEADEDHEE